MTEEEIKALQEEVEKLKQEKQTLSTELNARDSRMVELEQVVTTRDTDLAVLRQNVTELKEKLGAVSDGLSQAVTSYRTLVAKANPEMPAELITGDTIEAVDKSVENAGALVGKVKEKLETAKAQVRVPAGAPQRTPPDLSALSPREKIQYAIGGKR